MHEDIEIHAIILTMNEALHLERCIKSIRSHCATITVVDSGSSDRTLEIARQVGADIVQNPWTNYASQMNFAIGRLEGRGGWLLRIDADEVLDSDSPISLKDAIAMYGASVDGLLVKRRIHFMGQRIRHGAIEPSYQLRLWREGKGKCEQRWMDEHIKVRGEVKKSNLVISDINLNSLGWWINKHNTYASREAIDVLNRKHSFSKYVDYPEDNGSSQARLRRMMKEQVYNKLPRGLRAWSYFLYRYICRLGFLDGSAGFFYHCFQGLWYRLLVDAKVQEIEAEARVNGGSMVAAIETKTGIDPLQ